MMFRWIAFAFACAGLLAGAAVQASATASNYVSLHGDIVVGHMTVEVEENALKVAYLAKNNGRGPDITQVWSIDGDGLPVAFKAGGDTGIGVPADERLWSRDRRLNWRAAGLEGSGEQGAFYLPQTDAPINLALLAQALLQAEGLTLQLYPTGRATLVEAQAQELVQDGRKQRVRLMLIHGLGFEAAMVWLDDQDKLFASLSNSGFSAIRQGWEASAAQLRSTQNQVMDQHYRAVAQGLGSRLEGALRIRHVDIFDGEAVAMRRNMSVLIDGGRIVQVTDDNESPLDAEEVDGRGRTLLPGLWDMHVHLASPTDGLLHLANGVLSVRDMGNDPEKVKQLRENFATGEMVGPRVMLAGLIDGPSATRVVYAPVVSTVEELSGAIKEFSGNGYEQLKIYGSISPTLLPQAVMEAHASGLRIGGHVPAGIRMDDAVQVGFDEISHLHFPLLNFLGDDVQGQTNTLNRVLLPAKLGSRIDLGSDEVRESIAGWCDSGVILDATALVTESLFTWQRGELAPFILPYADRLPPAVIRESRSGGLPKNAEEKAAYKASFDLAMEIVRRFHACGGRVVPGTDGLAGLAIARELEIYVAAGIKHLEVLRLATLGPAEIMGRADQLGSVTEGKIADLFLVRGDPSVDIGAIRDIEWVMQGDMLYDAAELDLAVGMEPRDR